MVTFDLESHQPDAMACQIADPAQGVSLRGAVIFSRRMRRVYDEVDVVISRRRCTCGHQWSKDESMRKDLEEETAKEVARLPEFSQIEVRMKLSKPTA